MFRCLNCGEEFNEPDELRTTYEAYYGVASDFPDRHPMVLGVCPNCHSDDIDEVDEIYEEDE